MTNKTKHIKEDAVIEALTKSLGIVTSACKQAGISRYTFYEWMKDPAFKKRVDDIGDVALDFAESKLHKLIDDGVPSATIFYLKTKGKDRGYVERQEINASVKGEIGVTGDPFREIQKNLDMESDE